MANLNMHSVSSQTSAGVKRLFGKSKPVCWRKRSLWVVALHKYLVKEFESCRKLGVTFCSEFLRSFSKYLIVKYYSPVYKDSRTLESSRKRLRDTFTFRCVQKFMERHRIVCRSKNRATDDIREGTRKH